jgi:hypothetical protein
MALRFPVTVGNVRQALLRTSSRLQDVRRNFGA